MKKFTVMDMCCIHRMGDAAKKKREEELKNYKPGIIDGKRMWEKPKPIWK